MSVIYFEPGLGPVLQVPVGSSQPGNYLLSDAADQSPGLRRLPVQPIDRSIRVGGKWALLGQLVKFIVRHSLSVTVPALLMLHV